MGFFYSHHPTLSLSQVPVDPIVSPGVPSHHAHDFAGKLGVTQDSTALSLQSVLAASGPEKEGGTYWVPSLYVGGQHVTPTDVAARYGRGPAGDRNPRRFVPFPAGLGLVSLRGPAYSTWNVENPPVPSPHKSHTVVPGDPDRKTTCVVQFQDWWDGVEPDGPDWSAHCGYSKNGVIPDGAYALPGLKLIVHYVKFGTPPADAALSSGAPSTMHADFLNTWDDYRLQRAFDLFLKGDATSGEIGRSKLMLA